MLKAQERYSILVVFLLCCIPFILNLYGVDFSSNSPLNISNSLNTTANIFVFTPSAVSHTFLEWTSVILIFITTLIVFRKYFVFKEKTLIFWAISLLIISFFDAFHILATDQIITFESLKADPTSFTWTISRLVHSSIYLLLITVNLWVLINYKNKKIIQILTSRYLFLFFACSGLLFTGWIFFNFDILQIYYPNNFVVRPLDLIPLVIFLLVFFLLAIRYERKKSYLVFYLLLSLIPEIFAQLHMAFGSAALFDNHFNIAYFFKFSGHFILLYGGIVSLSATVTEHSLRSYRRRVSEQKDNLNKISELSGKSEAVLNSMAEAVINIDSNFNIVLCNQSAENMFEITANEVRGHQFNILLTQEESQDKKFFYHRLEEERHNKNNLQDKTEYQLYGVKQHSGERFLCSVVLTTFFVNKERLFTVLLRDLTAQKALEYEKEQAFNKINAIALRLDFALDAAKIGVWDYNLKTKEINWDNRVYQLLGYSPFTAISPSRIWRKVIHKDDYVMVKEKLNESIATKQELNFIFRIVKPNKEVCYIETQAKIFEDDSHQIFHLIGTNEDVTDRLNLEQLKQDALEMAQESSNMKSEFLACMSHEIRTPMNGVIGMLGLLNNTKLNSKQAYYLNLASSSAETLLTLINDILDFSKIEAGKLEIEKREFAIIPLLESTVESMAFRGQEKGLEFILDLSEVDYQLVIGDQTRLQQILINLINNAIKFTNEGEIALKLSLKEEKGLLRFDAIVRDTGIGISVEKQQELFAPFTQIDASTTRKYGGTGLGLAIVKKLCGLMNGSISVNSEVGKGTEFNVTLFFEQGESSSNKTDIQLQLNAINILIVVQNNSARQLLFKQLTTWSANVLTAKNIITANHIIQENSADFFNIVLIDVDALEPDIQVNIESIKQHLTDSHNKLILMTLMNEKLDNESFMSQGINHFFTKPFTSSDLYNSLTKMLNSNNKIYSPITEISADEPRLPIDSLKEKILLVEDNRINQIVVIGMLENLGLTVDIANNGIEAIEILASSQNKYQLVLMDCQMPEMDGYQTTKKIRQGIHNEINADIIIIAMTANAMKGDEEKCLQAGMNDYISKPINVDVVAKKLIYWFNFVNKTNFTSFNKTLPSTVNKESNIKPNKLIEPNQSNIQVISWDKPALLKRLRYNQGMVDKLVAMFVEDNQNVIADLTNQINNKNDEKIAALAHKIKGSALNLSFNKLAKIASALEKQAKESNYGDYSDLLAAFIDEFSQLIMIITPNK